MSEPPIPVKPLHERVSGPRRNAWATASVGEGELLLAAASPMKSRWKALQGLEDGAAGVIPLAMVHGFLAVASVVAENWTGALAHSLLTVLAALIYQAMVKTHRLWPAPLLMAWLLFELTLAKPWFGYGAGQTILNLIGLPMAFLAIRAALEMRGFRRSGQGEAAA